MSHWPENAAAIAVPPHDLDEIVGFLTQRESYPDRTKRVDHIETHISHVFLTDRFVYKLKKPVRYDFLDFSTLELRQRACENELRLNQRLAHDIYLDVVPLNRSTLGQLTLGSDGSVVDWLVKMRRLPENRSLDQLILNGKCNRRDVQQIAEALNQFYNLLPPCSIQADSYGPSIERHVQSNWAELRRSEHQLNPHIVQRVHSAQLLFLKSHPELLANRVRDGRIVEGHGDLRPEHIYLAPKPKIIDCIEFNDDFRQLDVLDELSFLAVECAILGAKEIGGQVLEHYCSTSGDQPPASLLSFYHSYRACVRAKVHALRAEQLAGTEQVAAQQQASGFLELADEYARELGPPFVVVVRGVTGSGKSTLARSVAESLGARWLQTDLIRKQIFGDANGHGQRDTEFDASIYTPENRLRVYQEVFRQAEEAIERGISVVLDGTFLTTKLRQRAMLLARSHEASITVLECRCPPKTARARIAKRRSEGGSLSDARPEFVELQLDQLEPDPPGLPSHPVDTTWSLPAMMDAVLNAIRQSRTK